MLVIICTTFHGRVCSPLPNPSPMKEFIQAFLKIYFFVDVLLIAGKNIARPRVKRFSGNQQDKQSFLPNWVFSNKQSL
jgi:hypothetical protein